MISASQAMNKTTSSDQSLTTKNTTVAVISPKDKYKDRSWNSFGAAWLPT